MFKTTKDFDKMMYEILIQIRDNEDINNIFSKLGDTDFDDAIYECVEIGLINGLSFQKDAIGNLHPSIQREIRLSHKGLSFIENFES
ncbi:TPA: hypothetical protein ACXC99_003634 [Clostridium botulinum]|uniref:hypothetical protein n=1 Tax=Clostridium botulinum TaxID=1491 RepID=UPI00077321C8|nr:hypothetical protein [Clostridium botulinum]